MYISCWLYVVVTFTIVIFGHLINVEFNQRLQLLIKDKRKLCLFNTEII